MGCCGGSVEGAATIEDNGAPIALECREVTSFIDATLSGLLEQKASCKTNNAGALFAHITEAADQGLEFVTSFVKVEMPETPGLGQQMAMAVGAKTELHLKTTLSTFFRPKPEGTTLKTEMVYAPFNVQAKMGLFSRKVDIGDMSDIEGMHATLVDYAQKGWRLAGMTLAAGESATKFSGSGTDVASSSLAELTFQKAENANAVSYDVAFAQNLLKVSVNMGSMKVVPPDVMPWIKEMGAEGYSLVGFLMPPQPPPQVGVMSFKFDQPIQTMMQRCTGSVPLKYTSTTFNYLIKIGLGSAKIDGDPVPLIKEYAQKGWLLRGAISFPAEQTGMKMKIPCLLIFEAPGRLTE